MQHWCSAMCSMGLSKLCQITSLLASAFITLVIIAAVIFLKIVKIFRISNPNQFSFHDILSEIRRRFEFYCTMSVFPSHQHISFKLNKIYLKRWLITTRFHITNAQSILKTENLIISRCCINLSNFMLAYCA